MKNALIVVNNIDRNFQEKLVTILSKFDKSYIVNGDKRNEIPVGNNLTIINQSDLASKLNVIEDFNYQHLVFIGADKSIFPNELIRDVFSKNLSEVSYLNSQLSICDYMRYSGIKSSTLSCFPGAIYPINMGSHQRAFGILHYLNQKKLFTDVLITGGNPKHINIAVKLLSLICPKVYTYKNTRKKLSRNLRIRRYLENKINSSLMRRQRTPDTFEERLNFKATTSAKKTIERLCLENKYKNIIVNYAWMSPILDKINTTELNIICDTHDVQYIRNETANSKLFRFMLNKKREKELEIRELNKFNYILAISKPDLDNLLKDVKNTILVTSGFDYAYLTPRTKHSRQPLNFGFIGGAMDANVASLSHVINEWWPTITAASPESKLFIAGSICNNEKIKNISFLNDSIVLLGFVDSLSNFYSKFEISLNPVFIKGGLNFKSVEAMAAGKILFTNDMGMDCLRIPKATRCINSKESLINEIIRLDRDRKYLHSEMRMSQKMALLNFSDSNAFQKLVEVIK